MEHQKEPSQGNRLPAVPLTLDGSYVLHQMFRLRWSAWRLLAASDQKHILDRATTMFTGMEKNLKEPSALFSLLGHKGDLMVVHFRRTLDELNHAQLRVSHSRLHEFLEPTNSYVSVVELGLYEASVKLYTELTAKGLQPGSADWNREIEAELAKQREAAASRLWPEIPQRRYLCFYPMNKLRGERKNWYSEPIEKRRDVVLDAHGAVPLLQRCDDVGDGADSVAQREDLRPGGIQGY